jgi:hypothetical protein
MIIDPFQPTRLGQTTCSVTAASQFFIIPGDGGAVELYNAGTNIVFVDFANSTSGAATVANSYPVGPNQCKTVQRLPGTLGINAIGAVAGPTTLYVTVGNGS